MESSDVSPNERIKKLLEELYSENHHLDFSEESKVLREFRILTREKTLDLGILDKKCISKLVDFSSKSHTEAQKSLSNLILNYSHLREAITDPYIDCVRTRFTKILNNEHITNKILLSDKQRCEILYYDLRIIFLLSALCSDTRAKMRDQLVDSILKIVDRETDDFSSDKYSLILESLKTLFNLTLDKCIDESLAGNVIKKLFAIVGSEQDLAFNGDGEHTRDMTGQLLVNLIHLLTNMPRTVYLKLSHEDVDKILNHLDSQLKSYSKQSFRDTVLPVLNVCANICNFNEEVRERWFAQILESATDFEKRPEEYDNLRGRLVKLMTSVDVHIKDIAAEFMHALCGGDTEKLITYAGFGNSAAFLSSRGLFAEGKKALSETRDNSGDKSQYQQLRDRIDPITGKLDMPRKNPMEGMSEEEKEYHANELANAISKLSNLGVIQPMRLDQDGNLNNLNPGSSKKSES